MVTSQIALLQALERAQGHICSGQELAKNLGISRAAMWKAVEVLRRDGYAIQAIPHKGYCLAAEQDHISQATLQVWMPDRPIFAYERIDSTNSEARRHPEAPMGSLFIAEEQTVGRGRTGKSFYSPGNAGLYMSMLLPPPAKDETLMTTLAAAVAVCEAIEALTDIQPHIKWLNDLYLGSKKVCGILSEAVSSMETQTIERIIVGIGINCRTGAFPQELDAIAASLDLTGVTRSRLAAEIAHRIEYWMNHLSDPAMMEQYRQRSLMQGRTIQYEQNGILLRGQAETIDDRGRLCVRLDNGESAVLSAGEIKIVDWERNKA